MKQLLFIILLFPLFCFAQSKSENNEKPLIDWDELYHQKYLGVGVLGVLKHPGAEFNFSFPHKFLVKDKKKKNEDLRIFKSRRWETFIRYYYHSDYHHNIILSVGRTWQRSLKKNKFFISQADIGAARTFYTNPTFRPTDDGVIRNYFDGDFYASFNYRFGIGKHFIKQNKTYRYYTYFGIMNFAPFNNLYYSRLVIGLNLNKFITKEK